METRQGEVTVKHQRTSRFYEADDGWYLRTREGISVGPYSSEFDVQLAASLLSPVLAQLDTTHDIIAAIHRFAQDPGYGPARAPLPGDDVVAEAPAAEAPAERRRFRFFGGRAMKPQAGIVAIAQTKPAV